MIPHLKIPFEIAGASALTVEQESLEEIEQCVAVIVGTTIGERLVVPEFGIADPTFTLLQDTAEIEASVLLWEDRAVLEFEAGEPGPERTLRLGVGRAG